MDIKLPSLSHRSNKPANVQKPTINDKHVVLNNASTFPNTYVAAHWSVWEHFRTAFSTATTLRSISAIWLVLASNISKC